MKLAQEYPVARVCQTLGYPRSSYYWPRPPAPADQELRQRLERLAESWPTSGYRRKATT